MRTTHLARFELWERGRRRNASYAFNQKIRKYRKHINITIMRNAAFLLHTLFVPKSDRVFAKNGSEKTFGLIKAGSKISMFNNPIAIIKEA